MDGGHSLSGDKKIDRHEAGREFESKAARTVTGSADFFLITLEPLEVMPDHLYSCGVEVESGLVPRTGALGSIESIYFRDPDENLVEIFVYQNSISDPARSAESLRPWASFSRSGTKGNHVCEGLWQAVAVLGKRENRSLSDSRATRRSLAV